MDLLSTKPAWLSVGRDGRNGLSSTLLLLAMQTVNKRQLFYYIWLGPKNRINLKLRYTDTGDVCYSAFTKLDVHFKPQKNFAIEPHAFRKAGREEGETINDLVTRLRVLASPCAFDDQSVDVILDHVIEECFSNRPRWRFLSWLDTE